VKDDRGNILGTWIEVGEKDGKKLEPTWLLVVGWGELLN